MTPKNSTLKTMKRALFVVLLAALLPLAFTQTNNYFEISKNLDIYASLYKELNTYYVDEVQPSDLMRQGIDGMLNSLDPYTSYISESEIEGYRMQTTGKYGGIGALVRKVGRYITISEPYEGYAANKAGLLAGDKVIEIDDISVMDKETDDISKLLKGQAGTNVTLTVLRTQSDGSEKEMDIVVVREDIKIKNVPYYGMIDAETGYIRLSNFTDDAGKEVRDALDDLKTKNPGIKGLVFDLRGNPGGLLGEAVNVSNVFVDKNQPIVSTRGKAQEWDKTFKTLNSAVDLNIPVAVLINRGSASASEIVAGSLQDLDRAVIIGQKSFGKGLVQTTRNLPYNTKLKITTAKYYTPSGRCIQALDYAHKDATGAAPRTPDSLKVAFKTSGGRTVYDGAGIDPDVDVDLKQMNKITASLLSKNHIFNYATLYRAKNPTIVAAKDFRLTDKEYQDFVTYLSSKEYDYSTKSEELIKELETVTKDEKYYDAISAELVKLKQSVKHDKSNDLVKHKEEIRKMLEEEIVSRYYYSTGRIVLGFNYDADVTAALKVLNNNTEYRKLLTAGK
ncbi:S41 family peptidase [soil metagenome]